MMITLFKALGLAAVMSAAPLGAQAGEQAKVHEVLVILTSASLQTQGMAMVLSNTMVEQGAKVHVLLCDKAGDMALKSYAAPTLKPKDVNPGQMLRRLLKRGGVVKVCALYLPNSDHGKDDLMEGVGVAMPPEMAAQMLDRKMRIFSF